MTKMTTVQIPYELKNTLDDLKDYSRETYAEIIKKLVDLVAEDRLELSERTKKEIEEARKRIKEGHFYTEAQVRAKLGL